MIPFLQSVATGYIGHYHDLSEFCFLFPNKRSARFFQNYLKKTVAEGSVQLAPTCITISDLVTTLSGHDVDTHIDLIFRAYHAYLDVLRSMKASTNINFEKFMSWGETMLSDFNEIDLYCVEADEIFKNVKDFKEISTDYLTEKQRRVLLDYFGHDCRPGAVGEFWTNFEKENREGKTHKKLRNRFIELWRLLAPIYHRLNEGLEADGLTTPGGVYRLADEFLNSSDRLNVKWKKMVAVGFNALSLREFSIFENLYKRKCLLAGFEDEPFIDFVWDATGPVLNEKFSNAAKFIRANKRNFPQPEWLDPYMERSETKTMPEKIRLITSPSNVEQTKIVGHLVDELYSEIKERDFLNARVAVVLPDEQLLLPLLSSIPEMSYKRTNKEGIEEEKRIGVNLTMGYELRYTSAISFVKLLRQLQRGQQHIGRGAFYYENVRNFLSHPFSQVMFGVHNISKINKCICEKHLFCITTDQLVGIIKNTEGETKGKREGKTDVGLKRSCDNIEAVFVALNENADPRCVIDYVSCVMQRVVDSLLHKSDKGLIIGKRMDISNIDVYMDALRRLSDTVDDNLEKNPRLTAMRMDTVFMLAERMLSGERVSFEGEPLRGLQVMGMLETRLLDFEHIIMPSLNEKVLPRKMRKRTFIPESLRRAYGIPPAGFEESMFAYYFYRLISRAKTVSLIYDSRIGNGKNSAGVSRYAMQLRYLYAPRYMKPGEFQREDIQFEIHGKNFKVDEIAKEGVIKERLDEYKKEKEGRNLSASALTNYCSCQVAFFYKNIVGINDDPEPIDTIDSIVQGNIFHDIMMNVYLEPDEQRKFLKKPKLITSDYIRTTLEDEERLQKLLRRAINRCHFKRDDNELDMKIEGAEEVVGEMILYQVREVLKHDMSIAPILIYGCEIEDNIRMTTGKETYNFRYAIDRLDCINDRASGRPIVRVVDYKTGKVHLKASSPEDIFNGNFRAKNIMQLVIYAKIVNMTEMGKYIAGVEDVVLREKPLAMVIYNTNKKGDEIEEYPVIKYPVVVKDSEKLVDKTIFSHLEITQDYDYQDCHCPGFDTLYQNMIEELFDTEKPFKSSNHCNHCRFRSICMR